MADLGGPEPILVDGAWVPARSGTLREIRNPASGDLVGVVPDCGAEDVDRAVQAARRAQRAWEKTPGLEKAVLLRKVGQAIRDMGRALAVRMTLETGKPLVESLDCVEWVAACFEFYAEVGRSSRGSSLPPVAPHQLNFTVKEPYGVVAAIVPFNFPLLLMAWKVAPALAAGNTVVCKPPHQAPLSNLLVARAYQLLPPGVVNVVTGDGPGAGEALLRHPEVSEFVAFTGSTEVGRHVAATAGGQLKKVNLELGGVDPFVVFADADLDVAVRGVAWARLLNAGQVCTSSKRIYLVRDIAAEFTRRLVEHVQTLQVGDPLAPETDLGPLITRQAVEKVAAQVEQAVAQGARVLLGGKPLPRPGNFFAPTILADVRHGSLPTTEEIFGPVISLTVAADAAEAIRLADDSRYGLGACVYTRSLELALTAMDGIKAGTFWVNDPLTDNDAAPFGGARWSGIGRELGEEGLDAFREPKHVHVDWVMERKSYWFPYPEPGDHVIAREPAGAAPRTFAVVGGAGAMGRITVRDLCETCAPGDELLVADYDLDKAAALVAALQGGGRPRVRAVRVDVTDHAATAAALAGAFVVVNTVQYQRNLDVMEAALAVRAHYLDIGGLFHMTRRQLELDGRFRAAERTALLGMGAAPGITNLLARVGADRLDEVREIHVRVGSMDRTRYRPPPALAVAYSLKTVLEEFSAPPAIFTRGAFAFVAPMSGERPHRFPPPVGLRRPMYTLHSEVATLPLSFRERGVREVSFQIAFDPTFVDRVRFLRDLGLASQEELEVAGVKVRPVDVVNKVAMSQPPARQVGRLDQYEVLRAVVKGVSAGKKVTWVVECHARGMPAWGIGLDVDTGSPPAIAAQMLAAGEITAPGAVAPEVAVPCEPFFRRLRTRRMQLKATRRPGWSFAV